MLIKVVHVSFFSLIICIINNNVYTSKRKGKFIGRCFFSLTCFSLVNFPKCLAQIFRSDWSSYVRNIFFHSFYIFEVLTHILAEEIFLNKFLATLFECNAWDLNTKAFFSEKHFQLEILTWISNFNLLLNKLWKSFH